MEKAIVVGTGPAGLTAALYLARADLAPLVVEGLQPGGQLTTTTEVENFPGFPEGIDGTALMDLMKKQARRFGARFVSDEVTGAALGDPERLTLTLGGGDTAVALSVVVATGASARYLGLESEQALIGRGVSACATCDGAFYRNQPVAVVGGGDTAAEEALFLARLCSEVHLIHRRDRLRASRIMAERVKGHAKISIHWDSVVEEVLDVSKNEVTGVRLKHVESGERSELPVAGLFVAIGHKPNTEPFVGEIEMDRRGFVTARNTATSARGVFAAGDVQDHVYRQAVTAAGSGCMAALEAERYLGGRNA